MWEDHVNEVLMGQQYIYLSSYVINNKYIIYIYIVCMVDFPLQCLSTARMIRFTWGRPLRHTRRLDRLDFRGAVRAGRDGSGEHYPHVGRGLEWQGVLLGISWVLVTLLWFGMVQAIE